MPDPDLTEFNRNLIKEFRSNAGNVSGLSDGASIVLLHHVGVKSGTKRVNPLVYQLVGRSFAIFASNGGTSSNPQWFRNLVANPKTTVEVGTETIDVSARVLDGEERQELWTKQKELMPLFAEYEDKAKGIRDIPVLLLERTD